MLIGELENNKRGIYGGAIGYIDFTGNMDTCIAIRIAYKKTARYSYEAVQESSQTPFPKRNIRNV